MLRWMKLGLVTALVLCLVALFVYGCAPKPAEPPAAAPAVEQPPAPVAPAADTAAAPAEPAEPEKK